jgi:hypothetical protein
MSWTSRILSITCSHWIYDLELPFRGCLAVEADVRNICNSQVSGKMSRKITRKITSSAFDASAIIYLWRWRVWGLILKFPFNKFFWKDFHLLKWWKENFSLSELLFPWFLSLTALKHYITILFPSPKNLKVSMLSRQDVAEANFQ